MHEIMFSQCCDDVVRHSFLSLFQIKYHKEWNEAKSNYTLTDTPQLDMAREAARILNQVRVLFLII